jgi:hypothetical protein
MKKPLPTRASHILAQTVVQTILGTLLVASAPAWSVDLPKQGSFVVTYTVAGSAPAAFDAGGGQWAVIFDARLITTNEAGGGMFHNSAGHCIGSEMFGHLAGTCLWIDMDGDRFVETINRQAGAAKGTGTLINGTGKYKGIEGSVEFVEAPPLADTAPGLRNLIGKLKGNYKIP